jgi:hypothetical protein
MYDDAASVDIKSGRPVNSRTATPLLFPPSPTTVTEMRAVRLQRRAASAGRKPSRFFLTAASILPEQFAGRV